MTITPRQNYPTRSTPQVKSILSKELNKTHNRIKEHKAYLKQEHTKYPLYNGATVQEPFGSSDKESSA
jgi:spore coat protein CotF